MLDYCAGANWFEVLQPKRLLEPPLTLAKEVASVRSAAANLTEFEISELALSNNCRGTW